MCNIMILKPGQMPSKKHLKNAVANNWHSYGLVTKVDGKLDIRRKVAEGLAEDGEENMIDWEEVYNLLLDDIMYERYLHLRYVTAGANNAQNCQPVDIFYDGESHVVFMHNGTFESYKSRVYDSQKGKWVEDLEGPSDTVNFANRVIIPYTSSTNFGTGKADINHDLYKRLIRAFWPNDSRGLLIHSKQEAVTFGVWKKLPNDTSTGDGEILTSNDTYFDDVVRGPVLNREIRRKELEEARLRAENKLVEEKGGVRGIAPLKDFNFQHKHGFFQLSDSVTKIADELQLYDREGATALGYCSWEELRELYQSETDCMFVMDWVFTDYAKMYDELRDEKKKVEKLTNEINMLRSELDVTSEEKEAA